MTPGRRTFWAMVFLLFSFILGARAVLQLAKLQSDQPQTQVQIGAAVDLPPLEPPPSWQAPSFDAHLGVLERPLFEETRRPVKQEVVTEEITLEALEASLTGVIITDTRRMIILRDKAGEEQRLQVGDEFAGWVLQSIETSKAELIDVKGEERRTLSLVYRPVSPPSPPDRKDKKRAGKDKDEDKDKEDN